MAEEPSEAPRAMPAAREKAKRTRPTKTLPTDRMTLGRQLGALRAYATIGGEGKAVSNKEVAEVLGMSESTIALTNSFFTDVGFLARVEREFTPSADVVEYGRAFQWDEEGAPRKLAPTLRRTWMWEAVGGRLSFSSIDEKDALRLLADKASASPEYEKQLRLALDYFVVAGLVERDGTLLRGVQRAAAAAPESDVREVTASPSEERNPARSSFSPGAGGVEFSVSIRVEAGEIAGWSPERISAFFSGFAQVLAAKGGLDRSEDS